MGEEDIYKSKREVLVLVLLLESYYELDVISVGASEYSSCLTSHHLLTI